MKPLETRNSNPPMLGRVNFRLYYTRNMNATRIDAMLFETHRISVTFIYVLTFLYDQCGSIRVLFAHFHNEPLVSSSTIRLSADPRNSDLPMDPYVVLCLARFCPIQWKPSKNINSLSST